MVCSKSNSSLNSYTAFLFLKAVLGESFEVRQTFAGKPFPSASCLGHGRGLVSGPVRPRGKCLHRHRSPVPAVGGSPTQAVRWPSGLVQGALGPLGGPSLCAVLKGLRSSGREGTLAGRVSHGTGPRGHSCAHGS